MEISHHLKGGQTLISLQARIPYDATEHREQRILATIKVKLHFLYFFTICHCNTPLLLHQHCNYETAGWHLVLLLPS
jgi:hypothetical protein